MSMDGSTIAFIGIVIVIFIGISILHATRKDKVPRRAAVQARTIRADDGGLYVVCSDCNGCGKDMGEKGDPVRHYATGKNGTAVITAEQMEFITNSPPCSTCGGTGHSAMLEPPQEPAGFCPYPCGLLGEPDSTGYVKCPIHGSVNAVDTTHLTEEQCRHVPSNTSVTVSSDSEESWTLGATKPEEA